MIELCYNMRKKNLQGRIVQRKVRKSHWLNFLTGRRVCHLPFSTETCRSRLPKILQKKTVGLFLSLISGLGGYLSVIKPSNEKVIAFQTMVFVVFHTIGLGGPICRNLPQFQIGRSRNEYRRNK